MVVVYVFFSYIIYDLIGVEEYMMSVNVFVCYESDSCVFIDIVLVDVRFFKFNCNYKFLDYNMLGICNLVWRIVIVMVLFFIGEIFLFLRCYCVN